MFTSDLKISPPFELALFADDTAIYCSGKNAEKIIKYFNLATAHLSSYCSTCPKLNGEKTQATLSATRRCERMLPSTIVTVQGNPIPWIEMDLGVYLEQSLTYKFYWEYAVFSYTIAHLGYLCVLS